MVNKPEDHVREVFSGAHRGEEGSELFRCDSALFFSCPTSSRPTLVTDSLTHCVGFKAFRPSRPNQNLAKFMGAMRKHELPNKKTTTKTKTKTMTMINTFRKHLQRARDF